MLLSRSTFYYCVLLSALNWKTEDIGGSVLPRNDLKVLLYDALRSEENFKSYREALEISIR